MNEWNINILNRFDLKETECILGVIESSKQKTCKLRFRQVLFIDYANDQLFCKNVFFIQNNCTRKIMRIQNRKCYYSQ